MTLIVVHTQYLPTLFFTVVHRVAQRQKRFKDQGFLYVFIDSRFEQCPNTMDKIVALHIIHIWKFEFKDTSSSMDTCHHAIDCSYPIPTSPLSQFIVTYIGKRGFRILGCPYIYMFPLIVHLSNAPTRWTRMLHIIHNKNFTF